MAGEGIGQLDKQEVKEAGRYRGHSVGGCAGSGARIMGAQRGAWGNGSLYCAYCNNVKEWSREQGGMA